MAEVAWPSDEQVAVVHVDGQHADLMLLWFLSPETGLRVAVPVAYGNAADKTAKYKTNVWDITIDGEVATVSPSIHFIGHFHSPNPVQFRLVDDDAFALAEDAKCS